jgi:hypothetical protein
MAKHVEGLILRNRITVTNTETGDGRRGHVGCYLTLTRSPNNSAKARPSLDEAPSKDLTYFNGKAVVIM